MTSKEEVPGAPAAPFQARTRVVLDVDTGVDDALALALALRAPQLDVVGITCVAGNGPVDTVVDATLRVLDSIGAPSELPVARGCDRPLVEEAHFAPYIHGEDCLGDLSPRLPASARRAAEVHASQLLLQLVAATEAKTVIIALAPLTNIALALRLDPELFLRKVERIVWMGGAVRRGGNFDTWSEANAAYDPEAAHMVLSSGVPITMYPWDAYLEVEYTEAELSAMGVLQLAQAPHTHSIEELAARLLQREMIQWSKPTAGLGDAGAVAAFLEPEGVGTERRHVTIELSGAHTRGMTVVDLRDFADPPDKPIAPPNVDVVSRVDAERLKACFAKAVFGDAAALKLPRAQSQPPNGSSPERYRRDKE